MAVAAIFGKSILAVYVSGNREGGRFRCFFAAETRETISEKRTRALLLIVFIISIFLFEHLFLNTPRLSQKKEWELVRV